jgi:hypothetical protein
VLNSVETNLASPGTVTDCPRFTSTSTTIENFNGGAAVVMNNTAPESGELTLPGGGTADAVLIKVGMTNHPHQVYSRLYISDSGWSEGLSEATEECIGSIEDETCTTQKRYTRSYWTQDNTGVAYMLNPRVTDSRVSDGTNTKRTTIDYDLVSGTNISKWGRVAEVKTYAADLSTVLKQVETDYNDASAYTDRRMVNLPIEVRSYGRETSGLNLMSRVTYGYDGENFNDSTLQQNISPVQHDTTYDYSFIAGRGNLTSTTRWDVQYPTNSITSWKKYNTAGSPVAQITPWYGTNTRTVRIGYADVWNDGVSRSTYAYPTVITDPSSNTLGDSAHSSTVKYRYDIGANVEATSPAPAGQTHGKTTKRKFDAYGRPERDSVYVNATEQSYTRYAYPDNNGVQLQAYSTLVDVDGDGDISEDEAMTETWTDGAGRVRSAGQNIRVASADGRQ